MSILESTVRKLALSTAGALLLAASPVQSQESLVPGIPQGLRQILREKQVTIERCTLEQEQRSPYDYFANLAHLHRLVNKGINHTLPADKELIGHYDAAQRRVVGVETKKGELFDIVANKGIFDELFEEPLYHGPNRKQVISTLKMSPELDECIKEGLYERCREGYLAVLSRMPERQSRVLAQEWRDLSPGNTRKTTQFLCRMIEQGAPIRSKQVETSIYARTFAREIAHYVAGRETAMKPLFLAMKYQLFGGVRAQITLTQRMVQPK